MEMNIKNRVFFFAILTLSFVACTPVENADLVIKSGKIYTVDSGNSIVEAVAVKGERIMATGKTADISKLIGSDTEVIDLGEGAMYPGFIEGHAHFMGVGYNLLNLDLMPMESYEEIVEAVAERAADIPEGEWVLGRGWHQDKWVSTPEGMFRGFPTHDLLSEAVPNHPVWLGHASGHAGLANAKAMEIAGITESTDQPEGGEVFLGLDGKPTGIFNETAQRLVRGSIPQETEERAVQAAKLAIESCLANGLTGFQDAGSGSGTIKILEELAANDELKIRMYVMLRGDTSFLYERFAQGPIIDPENRLTIRAVKQAADGALGSRGAWLLEEYSDAPGKFGHNVTPVEIMDEVTMRAAEAGFQVCIHAIGDRGNRVVLDLFEKAINAYPEQTRDHRFRVEHAQHINVEDIPRFASLNVIPSMQAIHMASDRPWAIDRLGRERIVEGAYVWQTLLQQGSRIVNGTDAPVEPINPIPSLYASVSRKTLKGTPASGYEPEQKMTREQALRSYTIDAAYAAFEEDIKGSIEVGKLADFTVLDRDFMVIPENEILDINVNMTIVGGEVLYNRQ